MGVVFLRHSVSNIRSKIRTLVYHGTYCRNCQYPRTINRDTLADPFNFDSSNLDTIRYSRINEAENEAEPVGSQPARYADRQTELSLSLKPARPKFSLKNGFGLNMFSRAQPAMEVESGRLGKNRLVESIPDLHNGFAYSAGLKVEHEDEDIDGTAYVSSGLLGLSYGRLGTLWYGGLDVNVEQFVNTEEGAEQKDVLSVDFTTGRRLGWAGTSSGSPLWMLSVQGNLDLQSDSADNGENVGDWFLNPSLFWQNPGFTFLSLTCGVRKTVLKNQAWPFPPFLFSRIGLCAATFCNAVTQR